jgi:hypothetical protein
MKHEFEKTWKGPVVACFKVLSRHFYGGTRGNQWKTWDVPVDATVEIRTEDLPITSQKPYCLKQLLSNFT